MESLDKFFRLQIPPPPLAELKLLEEYLENMTLQRLTYVSEGYRLVELFV